MEIFPESPEILSWVYSEQSTLIIQFTMIAIEKEKITLMINENGCYLSAPAEDLLYVTTLSFLHPVNPLEAKASFKDGYLTVKVPFKEPLKDFIQVPVE
jgi:HSP20 family molecular chaperone IbpA